MTPTQVWEGFNPVKEPLQTSAISNTESDGTKISEFYFTSETAEDGIVRVYCKTMYKNDGIEKKPSILFLPSLSSEFSDKNILDDFVESGYVVIFVDYAGIFDGTSTPHTTFPPSLSFAEADNAKKSPYFMRETARNTPWFVWAKICRRAITLIEESLVADKNSIGVLGRNEGAKLAWILAGIDGRLKTVVPIIGGGYSYSCTFSEASKMAENEERRVWIAGVGAETYARAVSCPIYFPTSSNNTQCDFDRAGDMLNFVPLTKKALAISPRTNSQITLEIFNSIKKWFELFLKGNGINLPKHELKVVNLDGELFLRLKTNEKPVFATAYYSLDEIKPAARDWHSIAEFLVDSSSGDLLFKVDLYDYEQKIKAFVNIKYASGIIVSTPVLEAIPSQLKITAPLLMKAEETRIVYDNSMGYSSLTVESDNLIFDERMLLIKEGPFKIKGVTALSGRLVSYKIGKSPFAKKKDIVLQMDVFSENPKIITINLEDFEESKTFSASKQLLGLKGWQRINFVASDFKSRDNKPLSVFSDIEKAVFINAEGVLFNNIIWL